MLSRLLVTSFTSFTALTLNLPIFLISLFAYATDWEPVTLKKSLGTKKSSLGTAKAAGGGATEARSGAARSHSAHLAKLEDSDDVYKHKTVSIELKKAITQARMAKKMTQKQLANAINERAEVIQEYENGKAIPNPQVLNKLDRALGIHLPRNKRGK